MGCFVNEEDLLIYSWKGHFYWFMFSKYLVFLTSLQNLSVLLLLYPKFHGLDRNIRIVIIVDSIVISHINWIAHCVKD
jgi:hypothetical protein